MANQKLNEVTTVPTASINNVKTFLAVMNDNSIQQMTKEDMATVLGGLQNLNTYFKDRGLTNSDTFDFNNAATGVYTVNNRQCQNQPINEIGVLLCFRSTYIAQFFVSLIGNKTYVRTRDNLQDSWRDWNELQLSQILSTLL